MGIQGWCFLVVGAGDVVGAGEGDVVGAGEGAGLGAGVGAGEGDGEGAGEGDGFCDKIVVNNNEVTPKIYMILISCPTVLRRVH